MPGAHELAVTHDGKTAYVSRRTQNKLSVIDLETQTILGDIPLSRSGHAAALGEREAVDRRSAHPTPAPAQVAVVDTDTMEVAVVTVGGMGTTAGHQWTSPNGHYTFAAFEGPGAGVAVIDHQAGNAVVATLPYRRSAPRSRLRPSVATFETGSSAGAELPYPVPTQSLGNLAASSVRERTPSLR